MANQPNTNISAEKISEAKGKFDGKVTPKMRNDFDRQKKKLKNEAKFVDPDNAMITPAELAGGKKNKDKPSEKIGLTESDLLQNDKFKESILSDPYMDETIEIGLTNGDKIKLRPIKIKDLMVIMKIWAKVNYAVTYPELLLISDMEKTDAEKLEGLNEIAGEIKKISSTLKDIAADSPEKKQIQSKIDIILNKIIDQASDYSQMEGYINAVLRNADIKDPDGNIKEISSDNFIDYYEMADLVNINRYIFWMNDVELFKKKTEERLQGKKINLPGGTGAGSSL